MWRSRDRKSESGAVLVEFAFAFPVLLLFVIAGLGLMWIALIHAAVGQAARDGARQASLAFPPTYRAHPDATAVADHINRRVPLLNVDSANLEIVYAGCADPCVDPPRNTPLTVKVEVNLPGPLATFSGLLGFGKTVSTTASGEVRSE